MAADDGGDETSLDGEPAAGALEDWEFEPADATRSLEPESPSLEGVVFLVLGAAAAVGTIAILIL